MLNPVRGEAEVEIAGGKYLLAADMLGLAALSQSAGCATMPELYQRLWGTEPFTTLAALRAWVQKGTTAEGKELKRGPAADAAARSYSLADMDSVQAGFIKILASLTRQPTDAESDDVGNRVAAQT